MTTTNDFDAALTSFLAALTVREEAYIKANFKLLTPGVFSVSPGGKRYVRVVKSDANGSGRYVHCFVERATGNIYKPAGWKGPTLNHVRGNIYGEKPLAGTNVHGTDYCGNLAGLNGLGN